MIGIILKLEYLVITNFLKINEMKNLENLNIQTLRNDELLKYNGGSLGFDIGWFIYWGIVSGGGKNIPTMAEAFITYSLHYSK